MGELPERTVLPLKQAYPFAERHGLGPQARAIQSLQIDASFPYPTSVRRGCVIELFRKENRWDDFLQAHWPVGRTSWGARQIARALKIKARYESLVPSATAPDAAEPEDFDPTEGEFAAEDDLRDYLAKNLGLIEAGLTLFTDQNGSGIEYEIDGGRGRIDILARDRASRLVVIELKVSRGRNRTLGQILYYMSWVDAHLGAGPCRGLIIARDIPTDLALAASRVSGIGLYKYQLSMSLASVPVGTSTSTSK